MALTCQEALYGGAAGGGKSDALLMAALQYVDVPGYAAMVFRRTYADLSLPGALMDRAHEWLFGTDARWNDRSHTWLFPSGATLTFGYIDNDRDRLRYQGSELQGVFFDELTQFTEVQYTYLFSRLRRLAGSRVPVRMRAASNPGGVGHDWVRQRFLVEGVHKGRVFVPARYEDNTGLDHAAYALSLAKLDPVTRAQLQNGDWDVAPEGMMFRREWFEVVDVAPAGMQLVRYWDLAGTEAKPGTDPDYTVGVKAGITQQGIVFICDVRRERLTPGGVEQLVVQTAQIDGRQVDIWIEREPGSSGKAVADRYIREVLRGYTCHADPVTGSKLDRAKPVSGQAEAGNIKLVRGPWIGDYLNELVVFPGGSHDDQVDGTSGVVEKLSGRYRSAVDAWEPIRRLNW